jgi:hypothetical protein
VFELIELKKNNGAVSVAQKMMKGEDGGYYVPIVEEDGTLTWEASAANMPNVEPSNITGPTGPMGSSGIYVGEDEPTDPNILVWLIPTGEVSDYVMTETEVKSYIDESLGEVEDGTY